MYSINPEKPRTSQIRNWCSTILLLTSVLLRPQQGFPAGITAQVSDSAGQPLEDAVISLTPGNSASPPLANTAPVAVMDQWNKEFTPFVLPVQVGTLVKFPNRDNIKHHVYSFSPTKRFELKLYSAGAAPPMQLDKPGIVTLGCNIHDWMLGYIDVLETPYFAKTNEHGVVVIAGIPDGRYQVEVWHPRISGNVKDFTQKVSLSGTQPIAVHFSLPLKRDPRRSPPRYFEGEGY